MRVKPRLVPAKNRTLRRHRWRWPRRITRQTQLNRLLNACAGLRKWIGRKKTEGACDVKAAEVDSGEATQALAESQNATSTLSGAGTMDYVKSMIETHVRQVKEQQNEAIFAAAEDTFEDALTVAVIDLEYEGVRTGLYKFFENVVTMIIDDIRIRDIITPGAADTVCYD